MTCGNLQAVDQLQRSVIGNSFEYACVVNVNRLTLKIYILGEM